ncbi:MAG: GNAT family N-acetyltransferase [Thermoplasmata archaeon]|nr:GNAT family N-acetyltransferase [Thermoplasmata archaeon]
MLRDLRKRDLAEFNLLITREFPQEGALLGLDAVAQGKVIDRVFNPFVRGLLGLMRWVGKPIVRFLIVEADGKVAATAIVSFNKRSGYIGGVSVHPDYRRRGFGRQVIQGCADTARAAHREFAVLDVLRDNAPALALYRSSGYLPLRTGAFLRKELESRPAPMAAPQGVRPIRRSDREGLAVLARSALPEEVSRVLPVERGSFTLPPMIVRFLLSETQAWVIDDGQGPLAFLRATVSRAMAAGNLTAPILSPDLPDERAREFLRFAESWLASKGAPRLVTEEWDHHTRSRELLRSEGFVDAIPIETLYLPLNG